MEKFNETKYKREYNKQHYSTFKVDLLKKEKEDLDQLLKELNLTKAQFLRNAIEELKKNEKKKELE